MSTERYFVVTPEPTDPDQCRLAAAYEVDESGKIVKAPYIEQIGRPWGPLRTYFDRRGYEVQEVW